MSSSYVAIVGDIGGTNARLQSFWFSRSADLSSTSLRHLFQRTYRTVTFAGLTNILQRFFDDVLKEQTNEEVHQAMETKK